MFSNLFNMSVKRTGIQALGFYVVYLVLGILLGGLISASASVTYCICNIDICQTREQGIEIGQKIGTIFGFISCFVYIFAIGLWLLISKKMYQNAKTVALYILSILLAIPLGALFALIPLALITTMSNNVEEDTIEETQE